VQRPIISLHYEAGNILLENGKTVLQVITDPHVRPQYLTHADNPKLTWAVFDEATKARVIELGYILGHKIDQSRVHVTGCPVDPRIPVKDKNTAIRGYRYRPLRLALTTGGLGTNKDEIQNLLVHLAPAIKKGEVHIAAYAGVHEDFETMFNTFAKTHSIKVGEMNDDQSPFRIFRDNDIIGANELLLDYIFPWADGFISKPSGDMAYEAVAAGCFLLTLKPWGEWEENIRAVTESWGVSLRADIENILPQLKSITTMPIEGKLPWVELALTRARRLAPTIAKGADNILKLHRKIK
jgi:UDP-N-acetylglucosamine:LPS N-acetylglucosamine transferase